MLGVVACELLHAIPQRRNGRPILVQTDDKAVLLVVIYGGSESYRHMCRYESGFFFRHPLMMNYEYYWRVFTLSHSEGMVAPYSYRLMTKLYFLLFSFMKRNGTGDGPQEDHLRRFGELPPYVPL
jgi:hypothetical protein